jgi:hypothetical protein
MNESEKPRMILSHWGEFDAPIKIGPSVMIPVGPRVKYARRVEYFDGKEWKPASA